MCGHPGEDFSRHPHFRKQEYFSCWLYVNYFLNKPHKIYVSFDNTSVFQSFLKYERALKILGCSNCEFICSNGAFTSCYCIFT